MQLFKKWVELHIILEKCNLYVRVAYFLRKVQLVSKLLDTCLFLDKSVTRFENRLRIS
jgi:hypothetical protein